MEIELLVEEERWVVVEGKGEGEDVSERTRWSAGGGCVSGLIPPELIKAPPPDST